MRTGHDGPRRVTIWLYPLYWENYWPVAAVDLAVLGVAYALWLSAGLSDSGWAVIPLGCVVAVGHASQMAFAAVRFDDEAITITRPWRWPRRVPWTPVKGLAWTCRFGGNEHDTAVRGLSHIRYLHLVLAEPRPTRTPVVMISDDRRPDPYSGRTSRADRCHDRILAELGRHGLTVANNQLLD